MSTESEQDLAELAPFYVAGVLSADAAARFEAALKEDAALARNVACARAERDEVLALNEAAPIPSARAYDALFARIDAEPQKLRFRESLDLGAALARLVSPRVLGWAALAACLLVSVEAGLLFVQHEAGPAGGYKTASQQKDSALATGRFALIAFAPDANAAAMATLLDRAGAQIVEGPRSGGFYRIRLGKADQAQAETERRLDLLRQASGIVRFVAPSP